MTQRQSPRHPAGERGHVGTEVLPSAKSHHFASFLRERARSHLCFLSPPREGDEGMGDVARRNDGSGTRV